MRDQKCFAAMENVVLRQGEKCFHHTHYLCHTKQGGCIPLDACPFEALVTNLVIRCVQKAGECARVKGSYDVMVWFRYKQGSLVGQAERKELPFTVCIPLANLDNQLGKLGQRTCLAVKSGKLGVIKAGLHLDPQDPLNDCKKEIKVEVEQELLAFEYGLTPVCLPTCLPKECPPPTANPEDQCSAPVAECPVVPSPKERLQAPTAPAVIKGKVVNKKGKPLFRARIKVSDGDKFYRVRTNIEGKFFIPLYPDCYELIAVKNGYIAQNLQLKLVSGEIKQLLFELARDPDVKRLGLKF